MKAGYILYIITRMPLLDSSFEIEKVPSPYEGEGRVRVKARDL